MSTSSSSSKRKAPEPTVAMDDDEGQDADMGPPESTKPEVWLPQMGLADDQYLEYDPAAYTVFHRFQMDWPSLSLDIIRDGLGNDRTVFPQTLYLVCGSEVDRKVKGAKNSVKVMKISDISSADSKKKNDEEDEFVMNQIDSDEDEDDPELDYYWFPHPGGVNRIRACPQAPNVLSTWSDDGSVYLWDIKSQLSKLDKQNDVSNSTRTQANMITQFKGHSTEGFAMDWSPVTTGSLLTGDCDKYIYGWQQNESGFVVDKIPYAGHTSSVEDLQWSPVEASVFASCSSDQTIRIWDTREKKRPMITVLAHKADVNVISWHPRESHLLLSGADDGAIKVWDMRHIQKPNGGEAAHYVWHTGAITSVQFHPTDDSVLAAASADNTISIWDMGLERDDDIPAEGPNLGGIEVPSQLLFLHQGQKDIKELRWHPQIPGVCISTALDGFNMFKPANIENAEFEGIEN